MIIKKVCPKYGNTKIVHLSKLELEPPLFVKDLNPVVVGVSHNDVVLCVHGYLARLRVLTLHDPKLAKHAVVAGVCSEASG